MASKSNNIQRIYIIAGEASGDILGAHLMTSLKDKGGISSFSFDGVGGSQMAAQGLQSLFPMQDLSVMGVTEILPRLPKILRRIRQTVDNIIKTKPDIVVTIDSPDFCFRVARKLKERLGDDCPPMVHYVAPTVWAWRPERAQKVAALYDGIICLLPIEPPYFEAEGMKAVFTGHPAIGQHSKRSGGGATLRDELEIPKDATVLGVLFGSRQGEIHRMGPILRQAAYEYVIKNKGKTLHIIAPTLPHLRKDVRNLLESMPCKAHIIDDQTRKWHCFDAMDYALATSGTIGLELAIAGVPHVIGYKVNYLTWRIIKSKINSKYAHLANILHDKPIVTELLQHECTAKNLRDALMALPSQAAAQKNDFTALRDMLSGSGKQEPSDQAADFVMACLSDSRSDIQNKKKAA